MVVEDGVGVGVGILVKAELEGVAGDAPGVTQDAIVPAISKPSPNSNALFTAVFTYATTTTQCTRDRPRASSPEAQRRLTARSGNAGFSGGCETSAVEDPGTARLCCDQGAGFGGKHYLAGSRPRLRAHRGHTEGYG